MKVVITGIHSTDGYVDDKVVGLVGNMEFEGPYSSDYPYGYVQGSFTEIITNRTYYFYAIKVKSLED